MKLRNIKNNELIYFNHSLVDFAKEYGTPLKITFLDIIKERVTSLKKSFDIAIKELNYNGAFIYLNANKANYGAREVETSFIYSDGLETSSYYDLLYTLEMFKKHPEFKNKYLVCNGYKLNDYIDTIIKAHDDGYHIIDIIDSVSEYEELKKSNRNIEIGLRIHLKALYLEEGDTILNDRFGLMDDEFNYILEDLKNTNLKLTTIHFHQRGFDYEEDKFKINFVKAFESYFVKAFKLYDTVCNFDMGGGTPLPVDENFDYLSWAKNVLNLLIELSNKYNVKTPNLFSENGKYSQKDSTVNIYKVVGVKNTDIAPWYIVDSSLLIALPEFYALGEPILVTPLNNLNNSFIKAYLGGITCDCDDVLALDGGLPVIKDEPLYIGCIGTGSYQNSMNGKGGVHHCMLPEEKDLLVYTKDGKEVIEVRGELQTIDDILKISKF